MYGVTQSEGLYGNGTIFKINPDGTNFTKLMDFSGIANQNYPFGALLLEGGYLYGTTNLGGQNSLGTIFKIKTDGTDYLKLFDFAGSSSGSRPRGTLISDGDFLYGMTSYGGVNDYGTVFKIRKDGTDYQKLMDFNGYINGRTSL